MMSCLFFLFFWQNSYNYNSEGFFTVYSKRNVVQAVPFTTTSTRQARRTTHKIKHGLIDIEPSPS